MTMTAPFETTIEIAAPPSAVWSALTRPELMAKWMAEPEVGLRLETDWTPGSPLVSHGFHIVAFENTGTVLDFRPNERLCYTHRSSISRLPDRPDSYAVVAFDLRAIETGTAVAVTVSGCPTEAIRKHLAFYWPSALTALRTLVEGSSKTLR
jgi:uncharacterized protein YndB with AHSA1/START domain